MLSGLVKVNAERCVACSRCVQQCALAHSKSKNEHNPVGHEFGPTNGTPGAVHAADITSKDIDSMKVVKEWLIGDPRVWYVIHKGKIWSRTYNWAERDYNGSNPHDTHIHVSLREEAQDIAVAAETNVSQWEKVIEPPEKPDAPLFRYYYSGKPDGAQKIGTSYRKVDRSGFTPPEDGFLLSMLYINAAHVFKNGVDSAGFRLRAVRAAHNGEGVDYSGYGDFTPTRNLTQPGVFLVTHIWFEWAEGGRKVHWEIDRAKEFAEFSIGTRYAKYLWVSSKVFDALSALLGGEARATTALKQVLTELPEDADSEGYSLDF